MRKILLLILVILFQISESLFCGEIVIINGPKRKTCGFIAVDRGVTYLYTSQSAIFGMKIIGVNYSFNAETLNGKKVQTTGTLEVSSDFDVARILVLGDFPNAFKLAKIKELDEDIDLFPESLTKKSDTPQEDIVTGIGLYSFTFEKQLKENAPGSPVINQDGKVVGVISAWTNKIVKDKNGVFASSVIKKNLAAKVFPNMDFVSIKDSGFVRASDAIEEAYRLQKEFIPLLNWWYKNPYRIIDSNLEYPDDLKRFVKYNNERSRRIDVHLKKMKSNPIKYENLLRGVRDNCLHRAKLFYSFPNSQRQRLDSDWKTKFLTDKASHTAENWDFILSYIKARKRSMVYRLPFKF